MKATFKLWGGSTLIVKTSLELWNHEIKHGRYVVLFSLGGYDLPEDELHYAGRALSLIALWLSIKLVLPVR